MFSKDKYCFLRGSNSHERLFQSFEQRQLDISIPNKSLVNRLIILSQSINLTEQHFALNEEIYYPLENVVKNLIHTAWKINFNQTIKDFRDDTVVGVYNLLKFSSTNQSQFHFLSSISSAGSGLLTHIKEESLPRNAHIALPQGYGQSKYIAEYFCWTARQFWKVPINIYRIGQFTGNTENGVWNTSELAPMMIYAGHPFGENR